MSRSFVHRLIVLSADVIVGQINTALFVFIALNRTISSILYYFFSFLNVYLIKGVFSQYKNYQQHGKVIKYAEFQ